MIASYLHNFIFVRTRKTASTSTEIILGGWCGPRDIVPPVGLPEHELLRPAYGGGRAQNFANDLRLERKYQRSVIKGDPVRIAAAQEKIKRNGAKAFGEHMTAKQIRRALPEFWDQAYKFAVDRHPYDKVRSLAWNGLLAKFGGDLSKFQEVADRVIARGKFVNFNIYMDRGSLMVDKLFRFEDIWDELARLGGELGQALPAVLPRARGEHQRAPASAREMLTREQKRRIHEAAAIEFELLGYER